MLTARAGIDWPVLGTLAPLHSAATHISIKKETYQEVAIRVS